MTFTHAVATDNYGPAKFIVSANAYEGTHTTIAAALTSASSGDTIFIRPGTYTENPTLKAGVNLVAYTADGLTPNVTINGKCTFTGAGTVSISGIQFETNSDFAVAVTGSAASILNLDDCYINCLNNTGISYSSSSSSSQLNFYNVNGNLATTGIAFFSMSSAGTFRWQNGLILNSGGSTTANTVSGGSFFPVEISLQNTLTISGSAVFVAGRCTFNGGNTTAITINSSGNCTCLNCNFTGGTASGITVTSGTFIVDFANVASSNTNAITGAGTIKYGLITYTSTSSTNNVSTQTALPLQPSIAAGAWVKLQTLTAANSATISFTSNINSTYVNYVVVLENVVPVTNAVQMNMLVSTNGGSSYLNTGYLSQATTLFAGALGSTAGSITTSIALTTTTHPLKNTAGAGWSGQLNMYNVNGGTGNCQVAIFGSYIESSSGVTVAPVCSSAAPASSAINAIQFAMSSGNISTGNFTLYGIVT